MNGDRLVGTELAGYRIDYLIGSGGGGAVYLAEQLGLGRKVALKVLPTDLSEDGTFRRRFVAEARTAATLHHPGIVTVFDAGDANGVLFISMLYVDGTDLAHVLAKDGPMRASTLLPIIGQVAEALDAAHDRGFVHRDVKPGNVLLARRTSEDAAARAFLSDFGVAKPMRSIDGPTRTGEFVGTIDYVAPEQIRGERIDGRADQYSLACVVAEGLTGQVVFPRDLAVATIYAHLGEDPPDLQLRDPGLAPELDRVVRRALSKEPDQRYGSCSAFAAALDEAALGGAVTTLGSIRGPEVESRDEPPAYTPRHLSEEVLTAPTTLEGERKQVTVMFCDVVGSTALAERVGPDEMHVLLDRFFERVLDLTHRFGGTVNQFLGDGFMALFGAPLAFEDHARRAALAAWQIQGSMQAEPMRPAEDAPPVALRIGLNTGLVVVGKIGDDLRMDYTAIGDTTNLAARLQAIAEPGTIVLSEATRRAAGRWLRTEPLGPQDVKGKSERVATHRLVGIEERADDGSPAGPFVGRTTESQALGRAIDALGTGAGGLVLVTGEAGIGKSRLLAEVARGRAGRPVRWLQGHALAFGGSTAYRPFLEAIRSAASIGIGDDEEVAWGKLRALLEPLFPGKLDEVLPYLAIMLGLVVRDGFDERIRYLDDRAMGSHVLFSCRRLFDRLADERPTVLVIEDVHWLDRASSELLEHLLPLIRSRSLLIVVTARAGAPALARLDELALGTALAPIRLALAPLDGAESDRLLEVLLPSGDVPAHERATIVAKAGGNPLFLEEVTRSLAESGALERSDSGSRRRAGIAAIPDTIRDVVMARVDRLGSELKDTLRIASVIGRIVPAVVLEAVSGLSRQETERRIEALRALDLLLPGQDGDERELVFKHALVQEAVYQSIVVPRRRELHLRVGQAIESVFAGRLEEVYSVLAHHAAEGKDWERAQDYLFRAGDEAIRIAADAEALAYYEQAVESYTLAFGDRLEPRQRATLERKIGDALFRLGRHDQAIDRLVASLAVLGHSYPSSSRAVRRAIGSTFLQHAIYRSTPAPFRGRSDPGEAEEAYASYRALSWMHYFIAPMNFGLDIARSLNVAERGGLLAGISQGCSGVGLALDVVNRNRLAARYIDRGVRIAEELDHPVAKGEAYLSLGVHGFIAGRLDEALSCFLRSRTAYREAGDLRGWGVTCTLGSWAVRLQGRFEESLEMGADAWRVASDAGDDDTRGWALEDQARTLCLLGRLDEAIPLCLEAVDVFRAIPAPIGMSDSLADLGLCHLRRGEPEAALEALEESLRMLQEAGATIGYSATQALWYLADHRVSVLEHAEGDAVASATEDADRATRAFVRNSRRVPLAAPAAGRARGTFEWLRGRRRRAERWWSRSRADAERIGIPFQLAAVELDVGRFTGDRDRIERALSIFTDLGAELDALRASAALSTV